MMIYFLTVLETGSLSSRCQQGCRLPPKAIGESPLLALLASGGSPYSLVCSWIAPISTSVFSSPSFFFFFLINFYWCLMFSRCCVSFCCKAKCISYTYTCIPSFFGFPSHLGHHRALNRVASAIQ